MAINWMMIHFSTFFDAVNAGIGSFIIGFQHILFGIPFYITILVLAALAWMKAGRGTAIFTALGLLLIYGMGFWEATMQTLALVFSSTCLALIVGVPLGVWTANSSRAEKILRPVLDLMQTMPAFVYLIPAVLFFGLGAVPGVFATIIFAMPPVFRDFYQISIRITQIQAPHFPQGAMPFHDARHQRRLFFFQLIQKPLQWFLRHETDIQTPRHRPFRRRLEFSGTGMDIDF
jgi:ABC-type proline/glycine betaine transport system permease subunit